MNFKLLAAILLAPQMIPAEVHAQASLTQAQDILTSAVHHWKSDQRFISDNGNDALAYVPLNSIEYPWSAIGILTSVTSNGETVFTRFCTATLVGPSLIVTAAHCVKDMPNLWFGLDYDRGNGDNVGCDVDYLWIAKDYEPGGLAHDWAFAHLNCNASGYGWLTFRKDLNLKEGETLPVTAVGYANNMTRAIVDQDCMVIGWEHSDILLKTNCASGYGSSGGPVFDQNQYIVGVMAKRSFTGDTYASPASDWGVDLNELRRFGALPPHDTSHARLVRLAAGISAANRTAGD